MNSFLLLLSIQPVGAAQHEDCLDECNVRYEKRAARLKQEHSGVMLLGYMFE